MVSLRPKKVKHKKTAPRWTSGGLLVTKIKLTKI